MQMLLRASFSTGQRTAGSDGDEEMKRGAGQGCDAPSFPSRRGNVRGARRDAGCPNVSFRSRVSQMDGPFRLVVIIREPSSGGTQSTARFTCDPLRFLVFVWADVGAVRWTMEQCCLRSFWKHCLEDLAKPKSHGCSPNPRSRAYRIRSGPRSEARRAINRHSHQELGRYHKPAGRCHLPSHVHLSVVGCWLQLERRSTE